VSICLNLPINSVSFGQTSALILKELFRRKSEAILFPVGNQVDFSTQNIDKQFLDWINASLQDNDAKYSRNDRVFKLWHLNGSLESFAKEQVLFSFYELDQPTPTEINIVKNNHKVLFSSEYTCEVFKNAGCSNVEYVPLAFDKYNFSNTNKKYIEDRITFNLVGKLEKRKNHKKVIQSWLKKYGNNRKYFLQCAIYNPFLKPQDQQQLINSVLEGKEYFNISFLNFMENNALYNDYLNSADIIIGMSGGEGWGLPEFHSVALGKQAVILNAHAYKSWANKDNSVLVEPSGKIEAYDNMFFHKGQKFNQGNIYTFNDDDFIDGCDKAIKKVESNKINKNGLKLQDDFSVDKLVDNILKHYA
jgi:hypothetical protein